MSANASELGSARYVALTTFRRSGVEVTTPVWTALDGDALVVITSGLSGKVKRLRNDPRITLRPCSASGRVRPGAPTLDGVAQILEGSATEHGEALLRKKYGLQFKVFRLVEPVLHRGAGPTVVLRITQV